jgi:predicted amidophosphoribosyltransferase
LANAGAQAVLDFLVEDLCAICGSGRVRGPAAFETAGCGAHFLRPVTRSFFRVVSLRNHPVCERCAGSFEPGRTAGLLGWVDAGRAVTTTTGERFEPPDAGDGRAVDPEPGAVAGGPRGPVSIPIVAPFMTGDNSLKIIHLIKFGRYRGLAGPVAETLHDAYRRLGHGADSATVLVPVPVTRVDRHAVNLPEDIARRLRHELDIPLIRNVLKKVKRTARQSRTPHSDRASNVRGAFACAGASLVGKRVLLVDDLVTTGATAAACACAILAAGAISLEVLCFARAL